MQCQDLQQTVVEDLISGEHNLDYDAGFYRYAELGDFVWEDTNGNGIKIQVSQESLTYQLH
ncbi:MAG: hypothetical protein R2792_09430 [Saprospiraceae bacterium]